MLDEGTVRGWIGTVLDSLELTFRLKLSMCIACMLLLEMNSMNCV